MAVSGVLYSSHPRCDMKLLKLTAKIFPSR